MKTAQDFMNEANAIVPRMNAEAAITIHQEDRGLFIDVRDSGSIKESGTIAGALRLPRGLIEFVADEQMEAMHNPILKKDVEIYLICGAGGQAALAGKTLKDMGFEKVTNIGGFNAWKEAGGATEEG